MLCLCGCGQETILSKAKYIRGHNSRVQKIVRVYTDDGRKRMGDAKRGKLESEETRKRKSLARHGKKQTLDHNRKISQAHLGKIFSIESRLKMSEAAARRSQKFVSEEEKVVKSYIENNYTLTFRNNCRLKTSSGKSYNCDIIIDLLKIIIEYDGCYTHFCDLCHPTLLSNRWYQDKTEKRQQDLLKTENLYKDGWIVIRVWAHEIKNNDFSKITSILDPLLSIVEKNFIHLNYLSLD